MSETGHTSFDDVREVLGQNLPFARHTGVTITSVTDGTAMATLVDAPFTRDRVDSQHAGALFTLGETASAAAVGGVLVDVLDEARPVVTSSTISYREPAFGVITATASTSKPGSAARLEYAADGRTSFTIEVSMTDADGNEVASMSVEWLVTAP